MIKIEDYILLPKEERQKHLKLDQPCIERGGGTGLVSQYMKGALAHILDTSIPQTRKIYINHACHNGLCSNPFHVYWGTPRENWEDGVACGKIKSVRHNSILKYGLEKYEEIRRKQRILAASLGGKALRGTSKTEEHKKNISEAISRRWKEVKS